MATFTIDLLTGQVYLFTGDFTGSGSTPTSGSTYPQVNIFADLPSAGSSSGQIYVVRNGSGSYVLNRKPSGFYFSTGTVWRLLGDTPDFFKSDNFQIYDSVDSTKGVMFTTSGISTNTFRKLTVQNSNGTIAYLSDLSAKVNLSAFADYTGNTAPATFLSKTDFNSYSGATLLLIQEKQDVLTAGTGISIINNIISVTGSTASWDDILNKPSWLSGTIVESFQMGHNHNQYVPYSGATNDLNLNGNDLIFSNSYLSGSWVSGYDSGKLYQLNSLYEYNSLSVDLKTLYNSKGIWYYGGVARPRDIYFYNDFLYVADSGYGRVIVKIDVTSTWEYVSYFNVNAQTSNVEGVYVDDNNVYVVGRERNVYLYSHAGVYQSTIDLSAQLSNGTVLSIDKGNNGNWFIGSSLQSGVFEYTSGWTYVTSHSLTIGTNIYSLFELENNNWVVSNINTDTLAFYDNNFTFVENKSLIISGESVFTGFGVPNNAILSREVSISYDANNEMLIIGGDTTISTSSIQLTNLPNKTTENSIIYIDSIGNLSIGNVSGITINPVALRLIDTVGGVNVNNVMATAIQWTTGATGTSLSFTGGSRIYIQESGLYGISYVLNVNNDSNTAKNIGTVIRKNGNTDITPMSVASFNLNVVNDSSTNVMPEYLEILSNGDYIELMAFRIGNSGAVYTLGNGTWIKMEKKII